MNRANRTPTNNVLTRSHLVGRTPMTAAGKTPIAHASPFFGSLKATTAAAGSVQVAPIRPLLQLQAMFLMGASSLSRSLRRRVLRLSGRVEYQRRQRE